MQKTDYAFFLGGSPSHDASSFDEAKEIQSGAQTTLDLDGLSMDERWASNPVKYAFYMSEKLKQLLRMTN